MSKQILLPVSVKREIIQAYKTDSKALDRALKFEINSGTAKMLRKAALSRGGMIYNDSRYFREFTPDCDTTFDHVNKTVTQKLYNDITLVIYRMENVAKVYRNEEEIAHFGDLTMHNWGKILFGLQNIYNHLN
jgi:hypothetical protein